MTRVAVCSFSHRYEFFPDRPQAQAACDGHAHCAGIYGRTCVLPPQEEKYSGMFLCRYRNDVLVTGNSTENSCVFRKVPYVEKTTEDEGGAAETEDYSSLAMPVFHGDNPYARVSNVQLSAWAAALWCLV